VACVCNSVNRWTVHRLNPKTSQSRPGI
jgi:hypothetical protein